MQKSILILTALAFFGATGCLKTELSEQDKIKVASLKAEEEKIVKDIALSETLLAKYSSGVIPNLIKARIEADKLTVSILRQHAAAIESGNKVTISAPATNPEPTLAATLEGEIKTADIELHKTKAESSLYKGGIIKVTIDAKAAMQDFTLATLKQKYLSAKYGLAIPGISAQEKGVSQHAQTDVQETPSKEDPEAKTPEINDPGPFDFRKARWGMNKEEIQKREGSGTIFEGSLVYNDKIVGKKASLFYLFDDDRLWRAAYSISEKYSNENSYVDDYESIVYALKEKYGTPKIENTFWSQDLYKNNYSKRGMAYSIGHVSSSAVWEHENTIIISRISGENYKISVQVTYSSKNLQEEHFKKQKKQQSSNL